MKRITKFSACAATLALMACSAADVPKIDSPTAKEMAAKVTDIKTMPTKTKAVLIYADWCGSCKVLDPKVKKVQVMGDMLGLEFVTLDYTDKNADNFYAQAEVANVGDAVKTYLDGTVKTGQLLLVDIDDQKVVGKVTKTLDPPQIIKALKEAIAAS